MLSEVRTLTRPRAAFLGVLAFAGFVVFQAIDSHSDRAAAVESVAKPAGGAAKVSFNREIRSILSEACFRCHGPDRNARQAELRLDTRDGALADLGGHAAIVPGKATASELIKRITSSDPELRMPPPAAEHQLTSEQIKLLTRWIDEGAAYEAHWSFLPPRAAEPPPLDKSLFDKLTPQPAARAVMFDAWNANFIDRFVAAKLQEEGLTPSREADRATLLRRVSFDLTGLPPTVAEVNAFEADRSPNAYEKAVDRLLASPRYGERMASFWLDAARYADTNGYQSDGTRFMWRWRDWVIESFNSNMPFDRFTIEQLAGDLLPSPTLDQRIATGFNRNHRGNEEGGIIPEEFRIEYVADRVETTSTVWLGLTIGCARCHDHKFDPVSQKNFYELFAFFNNLDEPGKAIRDENSPPLIKAPTREQRKHLAALDLLVDSATNLCESLEPSIVKAQRKWEESIAGEDSLRWIPDEKLALEYPFDMDFAPGSASPEAAKPPKVTFDGGDVPLVEGLVGRAAKFAGDRYASIATERDFLDRKQWTMNVWFKPEAAPGTGEKRMAVFARMDEETSFLGYGLFWNDGRIEFDFIARIVDDAIRLRTKNSFPVDRWTNVAVTYEGSQKAGDFKLYVNGKLEPLEIVANSLSNPVKPTVPLEIGARAGKLKFRGLVDELRFYDRILTPAEIASLGSELSLGEITSLAPEKRTDLQVVLLRACFLDSDDAPEIVKEAYTQLQKARDARRDFEATVPTTMVMREMPEPRKTHVLDRGQYDLPKEEVLPNWPESLSSTIYATPSAKAPHRLNRLDLAEWLVRGNPLAARVAVNRFWQLYFGTGIVKTAEDFGSQGEWPSHPELLDRLAVEFVKSGWDVKALQKRIVMSAAYRQSSEVTPELMARDPENRLLARGPRFRLTAEAIRDQALAVSGLLNETLGGPSVKPYQPAGLWEELTHTAKYVQSTGADLYRRSLYVYRRRTVPPPNMSAFDASSREACTVRPVRTNTPLQALTLLNDPTYVETSRKFAERILREGGASPTERLQWAFQAATSRKPNDAETKLLLASLAKHLEHYRAVPAEAKKLLKVGESPPASDLDTAEVAAYTLIAETILNLDETVTKQ
jgi:mono/diheme cytochrome c family protein